MLENHHARQAYERFRLQWMIDHGYSLEDLVRNLESMILEDEKESNGINQPTETLCFAEFNPEKDGNQRVCIGVYCAEEEDTQYYGPYFTAERNQDE